MVDLLAGDNAQDGFEPMANVEEIMGKIESMDPDQANDVIALVQAAIDEKQAGGDTMKTILKTIGTAVGFIL